MSIRFRCPKCQFVLSVEENSAGLAVECSNCSAQVRVPTPKRKQTTAGEPTSQEVSSSDQEPDAPFKPRTISVDGDMDMTPMVDVTFLLLVFFMVTAAFTVHRSLEVPPTKEDAAGVTTTEEEDIKDKAIIVRIDSDNTFWVESPDWDKEEEAYSRQSMVALVRKAKEDGGENGPTEMLVMASLEATHEKVIAALDAGSELRMNPLRLATMEDEDF